MIEQTEAEPELLRIKSVSVEGLFGLYDHTIPLNLEDRVTVIHGPNGVGKTKLRGARQRNAFAAASRRTWHGVREHDPPTPKGPPHEPNQRPRRARPVPRL